MKRILAVLLCAALVFAGSILLTSCGKEKGNTNLVTEGGKDGEQVITGEYSEKDGKGDTQIVNPQEEYGANVDSLKNAQKAVGFEITVPKSIAAENYVVISGNILEIDFAEGYIRKAKGNEDISGDYNSYEKTAAKTADGKTVTLKGNGGKVMLAIWNDGDYTYCIGYNDGIGESDMLSLVNETK
ncbi:MAG: hypothetical protein J5662_02160 [Clostridia bacterium]|nr:hypothetical protein [Clostridia bacterium]